MLYIPQISYTLIIWIIFYISLTPIQAQSSSQKDTATLESEISTILKDRAGVLNPSELRFHYPAKSTETEKIQLLENLKSKIYKTKYINELQKLKAIYFTGEEGETSFDYISSSMTLRLSNHDLAHPWISLLSWNPTEEDSPDFIQDQMIIRVDQLRFTHLFENLNSLKKNQTSRLPFHPYSSSYLPLNAGEILLKPKDYRLEKILNSKISSKFKDASPLERFDNLRQNKLGYTSSLLTEAFKKRIHNPKAQFWEGHCNQWSASSLDPQVNQFIESTKGLICDQVLITQGELKELFTLFYSDYIPKFIAGDRTRQFPTQDDQRLRNELGFDDLSAHTFHTQLHRQLRRSKGIVMEVSSNPEVWNQPVFQAKSNEVDCNDDPRGLEEISPLIPAKLLDSQDSRLKSSLEDYQAIEAQILAYAKSEANLGSTQDKWIGDLSQLSTRFLNRPLPELMTRRAEIYTHQILPAIKSHEITLKQGVSAKYVTTDVNYGGETFFAQEDTNDKTNEYTYILFKKGDQAIDGRWITRPEDRPDFLWIPENQRDSLIGAKELAAEVQDLLRLGKYCRKVADIFSFLNIIKAAISDGMISPSEKDEIQKYYQEVSALVDPSELRKLFKQAKLHGVDISEIFTPSTSEN